jgi:hypothetical protein
MRHLSAGDQVQVVTLDGEVRVDTVYAFLHREPDHVADYLQITTSDRQTVTISPSHLIFRSHSDKDTFGQSHAVFASVLQVGDVLWKPSESDASVLAPTRVTEIEQVEAEGVYAPVTTQGTLLVDRVAASCYAEYPHHQAAHQALAPLRLLHSLWSGFFSGAPIENGLHWYAQSLAALAAPFIGKNLAPSSQSLSSYFPFVNLQK